MAAAALCFCPSEPVGKDLHSIIQRNPELFLALIGLIWAGAHPWFIHYCEKGVGLCGALISQAQFTCHSWQGDESVLQRNDNERKKRGIEGISPNRKGEQMNA